MIIFVSIHVTGGGALHFANLIIMLSNKKKAFNLNYMFSHVNVQLLNVNGAEKKRISSGLKDKIELFLE